MKEIKFYYDSTDKIYDNKTGKIIKDMGSDGYFGDSILLVPPIIFENHI